MRFLKLGSIVLSCLLLIPIVARSETVVELEDKYAETGQAVSVPVVVQNFSEVAVFELYIEHDIAATEFISIGGISPMPIVNDVDGITRISWFSTSPLTLSDGDTLFSLEYQVSGSNEELITLDFNTECYLADQTSHVIPTIFLDGSISVYTVQPPMPFSLLSPQNGDTVRINSTTLIWNSTSDPNPYDSPHYDVWVDTLADLSTSIMVADSLVDTSFVLDDLLDDRNYYWTVRATDSNTGGRWASDTLMFQTIIPDLPSAFRLLTPADSTVISYEPPFDLEFSWTASNDPDEGEEVHYTYWCWVSAEGIGDTTLFYENLLDTSYVVNIPDSLDLEVWPDSVHVLWSVDAISGDDTTHSDETWLLTFAPSLSVEDGEDILPGSFAITSIYPNPFNPSTTIAISLPQSTDLVVEVFNILGQRVAIVHQGFLEAGFQKLHFNGSQLSSGNYFVLARTENGQRATQKMIFMK